MNTEARRRLTYALAVFDLVLIAYVTYRLLELV